MTLAFAVPGAAHATDKAPTAAQNAGDYRFESSRSPGRFGNAYGYGQGNGESSGRGNGYGHDKGRGHGHDDHGNGHCKYDDRCHASPG